MTFLFTDVVGSTTLWEAAPESMRDAIARHDALLHAAIDEHDGYVFATGGDGLAAAFARAGDAVRTAIDGQAALMAEGWPADTSISVRMGLHSGEADEREGGFFDGVEVTGEKGSLTALVRQVLQTGLEMELTEHLGYEPHAVAGGFGDSRVPRDRNASSRNGSYPKTVLFPHLHRRMRRSVHSEQRDFDPVTVRSSGACPWLVQNASRPIWVRWSWPSQVRRMRSGPVHVCRMRNGCSVHVDPSGISGAWCTPRNAAGVNLGRAAHTDQRRRSGVLRLRRSSSEESMMATDPFSPFERGYVRRAPTEAAGSSTEPVSPRLQAATKSSWVQRNALALACFTIFLVLLVAQSLAGWRTYNADNVEHGEATVAYGEYLTTGHFYEAVFENWESEFLQMGAFVVLTALLIQKGSAESKKEADDPRDENPKAHRQDPDAPWPVRKGGIWLGLYENSLLIAFVVLFVGSILGHALAGAREFSEEQQAHGESAVSAIEYVRTSQFWFESFQNWQSEFLAVGSIVVLTVVLRQKHSAESKPVHAPTSQTGDS